MGAKKKDSSKGFTTEDFLLDFDSQWEEHAVRYLKKVEQRRILNFEEAQRRRRAANERAEREAKRESDRILDAVMRIHAAFGGAPMTPPSEG
jgi:hypothetical protein